jgi:beta-N-acetylhexosaminidase
VREIERWAGQLIVGGFPGPSIPHEFRTLLERGTVGGAILFKRNVGAIEDTAALIEELRACSAPAPVWIGIDQEGGRVQRLGAPFPQLPPMRALGALAAGRPAADGERIIEAAGAVVGEGLALLGVQQDFAPVLDVDTNPANPVIGDRAFARDPSTVARLGAAFVRGLQGRGVAACGKHFPGHGDTHQDSHHALPSLQHGLERLRAIELPPFRAAIEAGVAGVMSAHVLFPALDPEHPATLSERVLEPLLRTELGFAGVIVSDDLEMRAITDHYRIEESVVRAVRAGCDQLLICHRIDLQEAAHRALVHAAESGALAPERLQQAASRIERLKDRFGKVRPAGSARIRAALESSDVLTRFRSEVESLPVAESG